MVKIGYESTIEEFLENSNQHIFGELNNTFNQETLQQKEAWKYQIKLLKEQLDNFEGDILFEYTIPRMGKRIDNVLLINGLVFILEFKVGEDNFPKEYVDQLDNYVKLLKYYHYESREKLLVPILISTEANDQDAQITLNEDVFEIIKTNGKDISDILLKICNDYENDADLGNWSKSKYKPTPGILESARRLYESHEVQSINTYSSEDLFLYATEKSINDIITYSKENNKKSIIFVTGVQGAGKTLIGLNIATKRFIYEEDHATFLSGNGPLVNVLQESLARDSSQRTGVSKKDAKGRVISFIQSIKNFRDDNIGVSLPPSERIVIFDEAQRSWTEDKLQKKFKQNLGMSEPEFLISILDRWDDWAVILCLVGEGQEIHDGEAGIEEWVNALKDKFSHWDIYLAKENSEFSNKFDGLNTKDCKDLYLYTTIRSLNAPNLPNFIEYLLKNDKENAKKILEENFKDDFSLYITRNLDKAKNKIKEEALQCEDHEDVRYGILAQSNALRLIPEGIFVKHNFDYTQWFLNKPKDMRSSNHLEIPATEFSIQGLEIDYSIMCWDANLRYTDDEFKCFEFWGCKYRNVIEIKRDYIINSYRVLLTRARRGMVIFVPEGDDEDETRKTEFYDGTYEYLKSIGIEELK